LTVERLAREELGLAAPGETVFLIHESGAQDDF
jgi:cell division protein FtsB